LSKHRRSGDGAVVVQLGRTAALGLFVRAFASKAGGEPTLRGSDTKILHTKESVNIKDISNLKNLVTAYEFIKSNPGNMTPGVTPVTLDGISLDYLKRIQAELRAGTFKFSPARRIQIPKPGKSSTRPLTIAAPREKVVQKALQLMLEPLFEDTFLDYSHGFRPSRGTRTAIQFMEAKFQSSRYIIEADFSQAFPSIPHNKLLELLNERIKCDKTLALICSGLKAGFVELGKLYESSILGTPQGSILSPLLCNIYLHKLDQFMERIMKEYNKGVRRKRSKEYMKIQNKLKYWRKMGFDSLRQSEFRKLQKDLLSIPSILRNKAYTRVVYVRYADDFIIGVEGSFSLAKEILMKINSFVEKELSLHFNPDKTGIVKFSEKPINFLGYRLMAPDMKGIMKPIENIKIEGKIISRRKKLRVRVYVD